MTAISEIERMKLFDVYPLFNITPVRAKGSVLWDEKGEEYLDLYGGHAVISIGHSHPHYIERITTQLNKIGFYSNSVQNPLQEELASKLGELSGMNDYQLFLCNSGAEANENALKLASFVTGRKKMMAFTGAFHGRTSGTVAATDNPKIIAPFNAGHDITFVPFNDQTAFVEKINDSYAAVIIEGIQGVGGIKVADNGFLKLIEEECAKHGVLVILDEIQCGYGRTGRFFSHHYAGVKPHIITTAKGMGNGFPIGGVLIHPDIRPEHGMLGTTFGGNHLACAAALAVLEVMEKEGLMGNAVLIGDYLRDQVQLMEGVGEVRGRGLMIGIDLPAERSEIRKELLVQHHIFTGASKPNVIRLLPSLALTKGEADKFLEAFQSVLKNTAP